MDGARIAAARLPPPEPITPLRCRQICEVVGSPSEAEIAATGEVLSDGSVYVANDVEDNEGHLTMIVSREEEIRQEKKLHVTFANLADAAKKAVAEKRIDPETMKFYTDFQKKSRKRR